MERHRKQAAPKRATPAKKAPQPIAGLDAAQNGQLPADLQRAIENPNERNLRPDVILALQKTHGNRFVQRLVAQARDQEQRPDSSPSSNGQQPLQRSSDVIQRAGTARTFGKEEGVDIGGTTSDLIGHTGDWLGTNPTEGLSGFQGSSQHTGYGDARTGLDQSTGGSVISTVTGTVGIGLGGYQTVQSGRKWHKQSKALKEAQETKSGGGPDAKGMDTTIMLLKKKRDAAIKGTAEGVGTTLGGISGFINGVAGFFSSTAAAWTAGIAFGVGAALGALTSTISAVRDFFNAGKRAKRRGPVKEMSITYGKLAGDLEPEVTKLKGELDAIFQKMSAAEAKEQAATTPVQRNVGKMEKQIQAGLLATKAAELEAAEEKFDKYDGMRRALTTSHRKLGFVGKIFSGMTNLVGAAGSAALLAATIGGVGAAAGPVGWILGGIALVTLLGFAIGKEIKQRVRAKNVARMNEEFPLVDSIIKEGKLNGNPANYLGQDVSTMSRKQREDLVWQRSFFEANGVRGKGWFVKAFSKSKSGKITMGQRHEELKAYLGKYDKGDAGDTVWKGIVAAVKNTDGEGSKQVDNPAYDKKAKSGWKTKKKITLAEQVDHLVAELLGKSKVADFKEAVALPPTDDRHKNAKELLLGKMKIG